MQAGFHWPQLFLRFVCCLPALPQLPGGRGAAGQHAWLRCVLHGAAQRPAFGLHVFVFSFPMHLSWRKQWWNPYPQYRASSLRQPGLFNYLSAPLQGKEPQLWGRGLALVQPVVGSGQPGLRSAAESCRFWSCLLPESTWKWHSAEALVCSTCFMPFFWVTAKNKLLL